jgi:hypothetical protein
LTVVVGVRSIDVNRDWSAVDIEVRTDETKVASDVEITSDNVEVENVVACEGRPGWVESAGCRIQFREVWCWLGRRAKVLERAADPNRCSVGLDGLDDGIGRWVPRRVDVSSDCIEFRQAASPLVVDLREVAADVEILTVRRDGEGSHPAFCRSQRVVGEHDWPEVRIEPTSGHLNRCEKWLCLSRDG